LVEIAGMRKCPLALVSIAAVYDDMMHHGY